MPRLLKEARDWAEGSAFEQRAAVAALCDPPLLRDPKRAREVFDVLDRITASLASQMDRSGDGFKILRQSLGYGWSIAVAAMPEAGKPLLQRWHDSQDRDVAWIVPENLKKGRLTRMDAAWVKRLSASR